MILSSLDIANIYLLEIKAGRVWPRRVMWSPRTMSLCGSDHWKGLDEAMRLQNEGATICLSWTRAAFGRPPKINIQHFVLQEERPFGRPPSQVVTVVANSDRRRPPSKVVKALEEKAGFNMQLHLWYVFTQTHIISLGMLADYTSGFGLLEPSDGDVACWPS